jgi:hypothetical protein
MNQIQLAHRFDLRSGLLVLTRHSIARQLRPGLVPRNRNRKPRDKRSRKQQNNPRGSQNEQVHRLKSTHQPRSSPGP